MRKWPALLVTGCLACAEVVHAQTIVPAPAPTSQSPAQLPLKSDGVPPCPTFAEQRAALGAKTATGTEEPAAQPAERSGILPSAGGSGQLRSAAPTVQSSGEAVRSPLDCPLVPEHPNAVMPGPIKLPELSKPK